MRAGVAAFAVLFVVACGGGDKVTDTENPGDSGILGHASGSTSSSGGTHIGTSGMPLCGAGVCNSTEICCDMAMCGINTFACVAGKKCPTSPTACSTTATASTTATGSTSPTGSTSTSGSTPGGFACAGSADCNGNEVCCLTSSTTSACQGSCRNGEQQICDATANDCPNGEMCVALVGTTGTCVAGGRDAGPLRDAAVDSSIPRDAAVDSSVSMDAAPADAATSHDATADVEVDSATDSGSRALDAAHD